MTPGADDVDTVEQAQARLRQQARIALGVAGDPDEVRSATGLAERARGAARSLGELNGAIRGSGVGWYPLIALGLLAIVDQFQGFAFFVLGPEISAALGISKSQLAALSALKTLAITLATLPMAAFVQRRARRGVVSVVTGMAWSVMTLFTGFVYSSWHLLLVLVGDGASSGSVAAIHTPLLLDSYPPEVRVRGLAFYQSATAAGNIIAPLMVGLLSAVLHLTWRGVFLAMGIACVASTLVAARLRDPGFGRFDVQRVRDAVRNDTGYDGETVEESDVNLGFFEIVRRVLLIPTVRRLLVAYAVLGMLLIPLNTFLFFFLQKRWGLGPGGRSVFFAVLPLFSITGLVAYGKRGDQLFRRDPALVVKFASVLLGVGVTVLALSIFSPFFAVFVVMFGIAFACIAVLTPALTVAILSIVPSRMRAHTAALAGIFAAAVGGFGGLLLLSGIDRRFGTAGAVASLAVPGIAAAVILRGAARTINADLDRMVDGIVESEELNALLAAGVKLPMLACRHIDFAYGSLQVLFDVSFTVDDGEMVALLGTNGAGKSTLLRVISGLGLPSKGSVRYRGGDVTYLDAERRHKLGIAQIPGGRAVFGPLTVVENMRLYGYAHGRDRAAVDRGIEASLDAFPALHDRRDQLATTLSGGEQQMLGLSKAFVISPRLLLIDELSLGLAPIVVQELLEMVRRIHAGGTAVVLVEQSVSIALSLVQHAYFMEKGEIRFDGPAADLLERGDLLRSVFLQGAAKGLGLPEAGSATV
ncbi:MAG: MFS transporter [Actinobacteria bacterium]|nr:MFS transporter [Actinomycetota bacterium]